MMQNLRLILLIVGIIAIIILLIHGLWSSQKEHSILFNKETDKTKKGVSSEHSAEQSSQTDKKSPQRLNDEGGDDQAYEPTISATKPSFSSSQSHNKSGAAANDDASCNTSKKTAATTEKVTGNELVLILHITKVDAAIFEGEMLLQSILQSGFQFGDMNIFHRHIDPTGTGPVLFSLINMTKPGTFEPDTMHTFQTKGISIFMMIPCYGDAQQNFKLMLQSAQRIADDVCGVVLDDEHHLLTPQKIEVYKERIRKAAEEQNT